MNAELRGRQILWRWMSEASTRRHALEKWQAENPGVSADWDDAVLEHEQRNVLEQARHDKADRMRAAGLPSRALAVWSSGMSETPALRAVNAFVGCAKTFLLLMGSTGVGKTVATAAALEQGGVFVRAVELARLSVYDEQDRRRLRSVHRTHMLVLDDLGAELLHDAWRPMLDELMDIRYGNSLQTIITTNLDVGTFKARYGQRIADRVRDDGMVELCGSRSLRGEDA